MDTVEFTKNIPINQVAEIFKNFFEQHMLAYDLLRGIEFQSLNSVSTNSASIMYSVRLMDQEDKQRVVDTLNSKAGNFIVCGKQHPIRVFLNGDLLCIDIARE